jgi:nitroimidazol reductase NimA-like FMN-containing flavoprotein (pyridoxamine 5'-phosphate oxidase superfamily)
MSNFPITDNNKINRAPHRGLYDHQAIYEILDAGFICQVGFIDKNSPLIIPMTYGRKENALYLHGASTARIMNLLTEEHQVCINVTFIDGIVVSRSMFDTSVNYRSVVLFGKPQLIPEDEKTEALICISEHIMPGRWSEVRQPLANELKATAIIKVAIESASAKIRTGPPDDDVRDLNLPAWAGVIPLKIIAGAPVNDPALNADHPVPTSVYATLAKYS